MPTFSRQSKTQLATCDKRLQDVANDAIRFVDFAIVEGHRGKVAQDKAFAKGASKVRWPNGNHNKKPSRAFDFAPWPIDWSNKTTALARFMFVSGVLFLCAMKRGVKLRFGWDWNRNLDPRDESFLDWGHVEVTD